MPYLIIDKNNDIIAIVSTIEEANKILKLHVDTRCEQVTPIQKEEKSDGSIQSESS